MTQVLFRSYSFDHDAGGHPSVAEPAGATAGDLIIVTAWDRTASIIFDTPTGCTQIEAHENSQGMCTKRFYRELDGEESWPLAFNTTGSSDMIAQIICLNPNGGSGWVLEDTGSGASNADSTTGTPPSVTGVTDSMYLTYYATDGLHAVETAPSGMTIVHDPTGYVADGVGAVAAYYEQVGAGAVQNAIVWDDSNGVHSYGLIVSIGGYTPDAAGTYSIEITHTF